jgi:dolichol-phosphate mannosyltransferase
MNGKDGSDKDVLVVIPTYNEEENIPSLINRLNEIRRDEPFDVLFIDDDSPDGTAKIIEGFRSDNRWIRLIVRRGVRGLGSALKRGYEEALKEGYRWLIQMDGDLQHPPEVIPSILDRLRDGFDLVIASRYVFGGGAEGWSFYRKVISKGANMFARAILGLSPHDVTSGFRGFSRSALQVLCDHEFISQGFALQVEAIYVLEKNGYKVSEVPFIFKSREKGTSKLNRGEIFSYAKNILRLRFS